MSKENWMPGIHRETGKGFRPDRVLDNPRNLVKKRKEKKEEPVPQPALPMEVEYLKPELCEECYGRGQKKGKACRRCIGRGVVPAKPTVGTDDVSG